MTRRDVNDSTDSPSEKTELQAIAWHLTAALDVVSDQHGRYHLREALQLLDAKRNEADLDGEKE